MYIRNNHGKTEVYVGVSVGQTAMLKSGWIKYNGVESPDRLKIAPDGTITVLPPTEPTPAPKRYSKLAIIRALDTQWDEVKARLIAAGKWDQFDQATYLSSDDPVFVEFIASEDEETKMILETCLWSTE